MDEQPYLQIPLPPPEWCEEQQRAKEQSEKEDKEVLDEQPRVIIIDI
tara:strand:+ start:930 stop:1070 length:141 start_codon:yes stop_codon:yes gene_type:complete